ncbi:hypothetical protein [Janthinobacterium violaceinigrum]|uniref:Peptidase M56 domain-containing protein n=1 Tax=Janthinobacterium violaceinigrum TaxID=2654252 RepID=A0A6I1I9B2_9BURK|nr:hypothetical protein [Janthinobacterium violaceinigrum]KAB8063708.1 hypothetical protein GCN75_16795 [Janthinobacterium violaceinigrum]
MIISSKLILARVDALTVLPFVLIPPEARGNSALLLHEIVHSREQRNCGVLPWLLLYAISARFRMAAEVRGYLVQIAAGSISLERAATLLMQYGVDITYEQAGCLLVSARG